MPVAPGSIVTATVTTGADLWVTLSGYVY